MERKISAEFYEEPISHDGLHDSLTYLASSTLFYEILYREAARAHRDTKSLLLFRFTLEIDKNIGNSRRYERALVTFAEALTRSARLSDISARIGPVEFLSLNSIPIELGGAFAQRVRARWSNDFSTFSYSFISLSGPESHLALLLRLDEAEVLKLEQ